MVKLRPVGTHDWEFLYDLLAERPAYANISHKVMPSIAEHIAHLRSEPYKAWYIVETEIHRGYPKREPEHTTILAPVGSIYLTHNDEIGIHIAPHYQRKGYGRQAIESLMQQIPRPHYLANISPMNFPSMKMFAELGFTPLQTTYKLTPNA